MSKVTVNDVQNFWEENPVSAAAIPFEPGTPEFFELHTQMRNKLESPEFLKDVYEWDEHQGEEMLDVGRVSSWNYMQEVGRQYQGLTLPTGAWS